MTRALVELLGGRRAPPAWAWLGLLLLRGLGHLYGAAQWLRAASYRHGWPHRYRAPCPVIAVGNLVAGGTGKTPLVVWLAERLSQAGHRVAVVSRGYRQPGLRPVTVVSDGRGHRDRPPAAADEAAMVAARLPAVAVVTAPVRWRAIAVAVNELGCDCVVLDDAFQHLAVARDLDLCLLDADHPFANGAVLPGGLLREYPAALGRADLVILSRAGGDGGAAAVARLARRFPALEMVVTRHAVGAVVRLGNEAAGEQAVAGRPLACLCGIARPDAFRATVVELGVEVVRLFAFGDHHPFTAGDLRMVGEAAAAAGATGLICTEKDAVKIDPAWSSLPIWVVRLELEVIAGGELLWQRVTGAVRRARGGGLGPGEGETGGAGPGEAGPGVAGAGGVGGGRPGGPAVRKRGESADPPRQPSATPSPAPPSPSGASGRPALLLDRDGTLIEERDYLSDPAGVALLPGVAAAIGLANRAGWVVVVVSNQSGIGRGYFGESEVAAVNQRIERLLAAEGAHLDRLYHCPHAPEARCSCRKPAPGMALQAAAELGLDLGRSFVIGDKPADLALARAVGATPLLVRTGYGRETEAAGPDAARVFADLGAAIRWVVATVAAPL